METQAEKIELTVELTRDDLLRFAWWHSFRRGWRRAFWGVYMGLLLLVSLSVLLAGTGWADSAVVAVLLLLSPVLAWGLVRVRVARAYASNAALRSPRQLTISAAGLASEAEWGSSRNDWSIFHRAVETKDAFYLYLASNQAFVLPKRCFHSAEEMEWFRQLVRDALLDKARF